MLFQGCVREFVLGSRVNQDRRPRVLDLQLKSVNRFLGWESHCNGGL